MASLADLDTKVASGHAYCAPLFIVDKRSESPSKREAPFYMVTSGEIVNIFPGHAIDSVVELRLKGAAARTFLSLRQAVHAAELFCAKNHPSREHSTSRLYRQPLVLFMRDFPLHAHPIQSEWQEDSLSFTPMSVDLFPSSPQHLGCLTPECQGSDYVDLCTSPLRDTSDEQEEIQVVRHCINLITPPRHSRRGGGDLAPNQQIEEFDPAVDAPAQVDAAANAIPPVPPRLVFYLIRLDSDCSYLFHDARTASRVLRQWNHAEGAYGDFIVSDGVHLSPDRLLRDSNIPESDYYYAIRGLDGHSVFSNAHHAQVLFEAQCRLLPHSSMMITPNYLLAGEWAFEMSEGTDSEAEV